MRESETKASDTLRVTVTKVLVCPRFTANIHIQQDVLHIMFFIYELCIWLKKLVENDREKKSKNRKKSRPQIWRLSGLVKSCSW